MTCLYQYYCNTEGLWVKEPRSDDPAQCKNDPGHDINLDSIAIIGEGADPGSSPESLHITNSRPYIVIPMSQFSWGGLWWYPYAISGASSWSAKTSIVFPGTDIAPNLTVALINAWSSDAGVAASVRIRDITNNVTVASCSSSSTDGSNVEEAGLSDLPAGSARLEVQMKSSNGDEVYCGSVILR